MKSTLMRLKEKTKTLLSPKHAFLTRPLVFRRWYAAAILLQTQLSEEISPMDNFELLRLFTFGLHLQKEDVKQVIVLAAQREEVLNHILELLTTPLEQLLFLMDLFTMSYTGVQFGEKEVQAVEIYAELFHIPSVQVTLLRQLIKAAMDGDCDTCMKLYANMKQLKMDLTVEHIRYYIPQLSYVAVIENDFFSPGKEVELTGQCEIRNPLTIPKGCHVTIRDARILWGAPLLFEGDSLTLLDCEIECNAVIKSPLLTITSEAQVRLDHVKAYCHNYCGVLWQEKGKLTVEACEYYETNRENAIYFRGKAAVIQNSQFEDCYTVEDGAAIRLLAEEGQIADCRFLRCMGKRGGAVFTMSPVTVSKCVFEHCHAMELANSLYYVGLAERYIKLPYTAKNQIVPKEEIVQELWETEDLAALGEIHYSIYFAKGASFSRHQSISAQHVTFYLGETLHSTGEVRLGDVTVIPYGFKGKDLWDISNGSLFYAEHCEFEGGEEHGIFYATGTGLTLIDCLIHDTGGGRAVYNSLDLSCERTIFSNCMGGAVYGSRARIKDCTFLNCREDKGAGIYLAGNKGYIKNCVFDRCIASFSDGGISTFGNYQVYDCHFIECEP